MKLEKKILEALRQEIQRAGGKTELAARLNVQHAVINRLETGTRKIQNMTIGTLSKLFPTIEFTIFPHKTQTKAKWSGQEICSGQMNLQAEAEALKVEYERKLAALENEKRLFELERENWRLKLENEELKKKKALAMSVSAAGEPFTRR